MDEAALSTKNHFPDGAKRKLLELWAQMLGCAPPVWEGGDPWEVSPCALCTDACRTCQMGALHSLLPASILWEKSTLLEDIRPTLSFAIALKASGIPSGKRYGKCLKVIKKRWEKTLYGGDFPLREIKRYSNQMEEERGKGRKPQNLAF